MPFQIFAAIRQNQANYTVSWHLATQSSPLSASHIQFIWFTLFFFLFVVDFVIHWNETAIWFTLKKSKIGPRSTPSLMWPLTRRTSKKRRAANNQVQMTNEVRAGPWFQPNECWAEKLPPELLKSWNPAGPCRAPVHWSLSMSPPSTPGCYFLCVGNK